MFEVYNEEDNENYICYECTDTIPFAKADFIKSKNRHKPALLEVPCFADTETSHLEKQYAWIYQFCLEINGVLCVGRKPSDFIKILYQLKNFYKLDRYNKIIIYIHNLGYDYSYLKDYLEKYFPCENLLAVKSHKILSVTHDVFIFRCSYLLSNKNLYDWGNGYKTKHIKKLGFVDYEEIHYQDSILSKKDWIYQIVDVLSMKDCYYIEKGNYDIQSIPLTSTGFVRKECLKFFRKDEKNNRDFFLKTKMDDNLYNILHAVFAGGYTHANRKIVGELLNDKTP